MSVRHKKYGWSDARSLAARMRQRVTIQQEVETADGVGGAVRNWSDVATVWAELSPLRTGAKERLFAAQIEARSSHRLVIRYRADVSESMRVFYDGKTFNIRSISNVQEANVMLELLLEEGVSV